MTLLPSTIIGQLKTVSIVVKNSKPGSPFIKCLQNAGISNRLIMTLWPVPMIRLSRESGLKPTGGIELSSIDGRRPCSEHRLEGDAQRVPIAAGDESEAFPLPNRKPAKGGFLYVFSQQAGRQTDARRLADGLRFSSESYYIRTESGLPDYLNPNRYNGTRR